MAKVVTKDLPRGIKLTTDAVFTEGLLRIRAPLAGNVDPENLERPMAPWSCTWHIPVFDSLLDEEAGEDGCAPFCFPMLFPPPQQLFSEDFVVDTTTPQLILDEIHISWDSRDEPLSTLDAFNNWLAAADSLTNTLANAEERLHFVIRLYEKTPSISQYDVDKALISFELDSLANESQTTRLNPCVFSKPGMAVLNPYKTYVLAVYAPNSYDPTKTDQERIGFPGFTARLEGRTSILEPETLEEIRNAPTAHFDVPAAAAPTITVPASNSVIESVTADGLGTGLETLDEAFLFKLRGGLDKNGESRPTRQLSSYAAMDIIAVPMFQQMGPMHQVFCGAAAPPGSPIPPYCPYYVDTVGEQIADRRIIPITYPFTIHHVFAVHSAGLTEWPTGHRGLWPATDTYTDYIGVGIGVGHKGNFFDYQQVAYGAMTVANKANYAVDRFNLPRLTNYTLLVQPSQLYEYEVFEVPLYNASPLVPDEGSSFKETKYPYFVGTGDTRTRLRNNVFNQPIGLESMPLTEGSEQWIEVRWVIEDTTGLNNNFTHDQAETYVGVCGAWILLVGTRYLASE